MGNISRNDRVIMQNGRPPTQSDGRLIIYGDAKQTAGPPPAFRDVGNANPDKILADQFSDN